MVGIFDESLKKSGYKPVKTILIPHEHDGIKGFIPLTVWVPPKQKLKRKGAD